MKKYKRILWLALLVGLLVCHCATPAFALTEAEVQEQVDSVGREAVGGNIFVWFLCAIAFLKVSQKIDSFMSSLGINVGHTGGSMMAEAIIAARGISAARGFAGRVKGTGGAGKSSAGQSAGFMKGGLAGVVSRNFTSGAVKNATSGSGGGLGGAAFASSVTKGGDMANSVIGTVATGSIATVGSMTGEKAEQALLSYMGYAALGESAEDVPSFSNVEIGGGRITGMETSEEYPSGSAFAMYHTDQFSEPSREYSTVTAADGSKWYKQYAQDTVEKTPYMAPDGSIAYNEKIVKKLPDPPRRKDKF
ncbi:MAG: hypothetical protein PHY23_00885 [Oscillospiraceae bacterium]|nr:hypothetical protein [Oscillospiraceae bacterium]